MKQQKTNMYTDIITQSINLRRFNVCSIQANRNTVIVEPKGTPDGYDLDWVTFEWLVSQNTIGIWFFTPREYHQETRYIKNVSQKSLKQIKTEITSIMKSFNFANFW